MARDQVDLTPIERRDDLVDWIAQGIKPKSHFRIGTEHEKFAVHARGPPAGALSRGAAASARCSKACSTCSAGSRSSEGDNIIGLFDVTGGGAISLEPGGQFELSGAPVETVHQTSSELMAHLAQVREVARAAWHRLPRHRHDADLDARRHAANAEGPLQDHDRLHAEGRHARPRHDVSHLHRADQSRLLVRSRHGQEAARVARAAAGRDRAVRQFAVHRRQAERLPLVPRRNLARHRQRTAPACCRGRSSPAWASSARSTTRSTCRCISSSAATTMSTSPASRSAI